MAKCLVSLHDMPDLFRAKINNQMLASFVSKQPVNKELEHREYSTAGGTTKALQRREHLVRA